MSLKGASTVKYTSPLTWIGLSDNDSKLYTNFESCEGKKSESFEKHIDLQGQVIYADKFDFQEEIYRF